MTEEKPGSGELEKATEEKGSKSWGERIKAFMRECGIELTLWAIVVVLAVACIWQGKELSSRNKIIETQDIMLMIANRRIEVLKGGNGGGGGRSPLTGTDAFREGGTEIETVLVEMEGADGILR